MGSVEKLIEDAGLGSLSWFGDELLSALSSEDLEGLGDKEDDEDDDELDDISSLGFSDISHLGIQPTPSQAALPTHAERGGDEMRRELKRQASLISERDEEAKHQRALLERRLQYIQQRHSVEIAALIAKHQNELQPTARALQQAQAEASSLRERLAANKAEVLAGLPVSEARLRELQDQPVESLGLKEGIQRHVGELLQQAAQTRDAYRREIDALREIITSTNRELIERQARLDEVHATASVREIEHGKRLAEMQGTCLSLQRDNEDLRTKLKICEDRSARCEESETKLAGAGERILALEKELEATKEELKMCKMERGSQNIQMEERKQQVEILQMDKQFLTKEVDSLREANTRLEERAEKMSAKAKEAKRAKESMQEQMANQQALAGVHVEDRLQTELSALRQRAEEEIREVKRNTQEFYSRQLDAAQQAKEEAQGELQRLRARADQLQMERDQAMREHMQLTATMDESIGDVRGQLRMREFELERLTVTHEDSQALLRQLRLENDMYRGKLDVLKTEFYKLQSDSTARITELETATEQARAKLSAYQSIESHLNIAVEGIDVFADASGEDAQRQIVSMGSGLPTDPQRRLVQVMSLASKVVEQQKRIQQLTRTMEDQESLIEKLRKEIVEANKMLDQTSQPHNMFVATIRARDEELRAAGREMERIKQQLAIVSDERDQLRQHTAHLRNDLQRVLDHKQTALSIQTAVAELQQQQRIGQIRLHDVTNVLGSLTAGGGASNVLERASVIVPAAQGGIGSSTVTGLGGGLHGGLGGLPQGGIGGSSSGIVPVGGGTQPPAVWFTKLKARVGGGGVQR